MKLVYLGTPDMAVPPLRALHGAGHEIALVVSGADKRRGRRGAPSRRARSRRRRSSSAWQVSDDPDDLLDVGADLGVVVAYGRLLRPHLLAALDMVNLHFSLLPRWRGAAPVERAILAGDELTGVCLMDGRGGARHRVRVRPRRGADRTRHHRGSAACHAGRRGDLDCWWRPRPGPRRPACRRRTTASPTQRS